MKIEYVAGCMLKKTTDWVPPEKEAYEPQDKMKDFLLNETETLLMKTLVEKQYKNYIKILRKNRSEVFFESADTEIELPAYFVVVSKKDKTKKQVVLFDVVEGWKIENVKKNGVNNYTRQILASVWAYEKTEIVSMVYYSLDNGEIEQFNFNAEEMQKEAEYVLKKAKIFAAFNGFKKDLQEMILSVKDKTFLRLPEEAWECKKCDLENCPFDKKKTM